MKVFGLTQLSRKVPELLKKEVKFKNEPEKWNWKPFNPEKIRDLKNIIEKEKKSVNYACMTNYTPSDIKQKVLLVFAIGNLNYGFINYLEKGNFKYFFLDYTQFIIKGEIIVRIENGTQKKIFKINDLILNLDDVSAIVWNPPKYLKPLIDFNHIHPKKNRNAFLFRKRWVQLLKDLIYLLPETVIWLPGNPLNGSQDWQNKVGEYSVAQSLGLNIPPLIFTNDINELKEFIINHGGDLMLREFSTPPYSFPPVRINAKKISFRNFHTSPSCFQKYIEKKHEYRVIVLFKKVFACKIYSQDSDLAKNDWRVYDDSNVKWELVELPKDINEKLIALMEKMHLNWCSIDLIYGTDDKYYYLEANRPGAHYWLDPFVGLDITKEIVDEFYKRDFLESYSIKS
ncbi:MAG: hypothetical protein A2X14_01470 [Bacteroidetes bacterium GWD2_33_33]|nr:MAG: hypothetical protein A2X14_01470 [Bacteroidetes bacterium GWD2_33_33]